MEKFIYRLAIVTPNEVEEMLPVYFVYEATALGFAELYVRLNWSNYSSLLEEYNHNKTGDTASCFFSTEYKGSRRYKFEFLYKDMRSSVIRYLAITRIEVVTINM